MKGFGNLPFGAVMLTVLCCVGGCTSAKGIWRSEIMDERSVSMEEVLQLKIDDRIYTTNNLWVVKDCVLSADNPVGGENFLPIGTEVTPVAASVRGVDFSDADGRLWHLEFNAAKMQMAIEDYILQTFSTTSPEEKLSECAPEIADAIRSGRIIPGMSRDEVIMCCGIPSPVRTPAQTNGIWIYNTLTPGHSLRVIFRGSTVREAAYLDK